MSYRKTRSKQEQTREIVTRIKKLREEHNEAQWELADSINISTTRLQNIEQSKSCPDTDTAILIAKHYNVNLDYLCGLSDDMTVPQDVLDTLCRYISVETRVMSMTQSHEIPFISISKNLFDYLNTLDRAKQLKKKEVPEDVVDAWIEKETQKTLSSLQNATDQVEFALLSDRDIASDEVMALLERAYRESNG